jgi:hypothetical protein
MRINLSSGMLRFTIKIVFTAALDISLPGTNWRGEKMPSLQKENEKLEEARERRQTENRLKSCVVPSQPVELIYT